MARREETMSHHKIASRGDIVDDIRQFDSTVLGASFDAMTPITRLSATVHDGDDKHVIGLDGVEHRVWKYMNEAAAHIRLEGTAARRSLGNLTKC